FGIKGGANFTFFNTDEQQFGEDPTIEVGYFGGVYIDLMRSENFHYQLDVLYVGIGEFQFINAPIYVEYYVAPDLSLLVGPSMNYFFDLFVNKFKVRADLSAAYHLSERLSLGLKYTLGFEELSPNVLFLGFDVRI
ncbi:MAG: hypothetical protein R3359_09950, partial [Marinirhabdus sp.]|nr:hypothetical protein [Marinirhabdus sp.]